MSAGWQIAHVIAFAPLFVLSLASLGTDSDTWPFFAAVVAIGVGSFFYLSHQ